MLSVRKFFRDGWVCATNFLRILCYRQRLLSQRCPSELCQTLRSYARHFRAMLHPSGLCCTLCELRCILLCILRSIFSKQSYTLLSFDGSFWATLHPLSYVVPVPYWAKVRPTELRCTYWAKIKYALLSYTPHPPELLYNAPFWPTLLYVLYHTPSER
jgi:hypothetical protein